MKKINLLILFFMLVNLPVFLFADNFETGFKFMEQGDYKSAITIWDNLLLKNNTNIKVLIQRGEAYRLLGYNKNAIDDLTRAALLSKELSNKNNNNEMLLMSSMALAQTYLQDRQTDSTINILNLSLELAHELQRHDLMAAAYNMLGIIALSQKDVDSARINYLKGIEFASKANDTSLLASMQVNLSKVATDKKYINKLLNHAYKNCTYISNDMERTILLISVGVQATNNKMYSIALRALTASLVDARLLNNAHLLSQAQGYLGNMYEKKLQYEKAHELTTSAINTAQKISAEDLLLQWEWQQARIENVNGYKQAAIFSYRNAIAHIQSIRNDIPIQYSDGRSSFRETLSPIYLGLVELLLNSADEQKSNNVQQKLLTEALETIELFKTAEMQDYYKDSCVVKNNSSKNLTTIPDGSAVLYPVIFPDKMDLLLQIGEQKYHFVSFVSQSFLRSLIKRLTANLKPDMFGQLSPYNFTIANILFDILIKPIEHLLREKKIDTLVFAPDGILRSLPIATLWDGKQFLIEKYAVANIAGLTLVDMNSLDKNLLEKDKLSALLAGISSPGSIVEKLSVTFQKQLTAIPDSSRNVQQSPLRTRRFTMRELPEFYAPAKHKQTRDFPMESPALIALQESLEIPGVLNEIKAISSIIESRQLINEKFKLNNFISAVDNNYQIIHIASHGFFSGSPESSFIITYDELLNMVKLKEIFQSEAFSDSPIEILTLSACETAEGDDRSPLGLSGVVLQSGVKTVLGSLWPVADEVATILLPDFYNNFVSHHDSKARALQQAQIKLLKSKDYSHPGLWSAFILVGNWN